MWHVYRGINHNKKQVYHGASPDPAARRDGSHCVGGTKALKRWNCTKDKIIWRIVSSHRTRAKASEVAHYWEKNYKHSLGFKNIRTGGT